jgi:cytochrome c-type biogenesis protein CcmH/NrfG
VTATGRAGVDPDRLAELEEERRFLLRSLADLEREHDAGDIDDVDYRELRDGYTVRAAATLRAIEDGRAALPARPPVDWRRRLVVGVVVIAMIAIVWWALSTWSAQRLPGQTPTGLDPRDRTTVLVAQARAVMFQQPDVAADLYAQVLDLDPSNVEALTYRGWTLALSTRAMTDTGEVAAVLRDSVESLGQAIEIDPDYPDPQCFLGIIQVRFLDSATSAVPFLERCLDGNPPADIRVLVEPLLDEARAG